ncbi:hypothetical protein J132_04381 [Termitomyces sp. J132]|nr:hypothetical protein J132_04381 [Termitomyces sp. J132]
MPYFLPVQKFLFFAVIVSRISAFNVSISIPPRAAINAPRVLPSLISLSIELDRWTDWAGTTSRNEFFFNTLDNLRQLTGQPPNIRIGGNTEDHTNFHQDVEFSETIFPPFTPVAPYPEATNVTVGDSFYATTRFLPPTPGVSNTAGAALWTLDYALFATQLGISTVFFHEGKNMMYQIQPTTLARSTLDGSSLPTPAPPHVQPQYYAAVIAGEAIGKTGKAQVLEIDIDHPQIAGYSFYEDYLLVRAVFINSKAYLPESTIRTSVHLDFKFTNVHGFKAATTMTLKRLAIAYATDASGLTWGGQTYETSDGRVANSVVTETRLVSDGLDIQETEVILVVFES